MLGEILLGGAIEVGFWLGGWWACRKLKGHGSDVLGHDSIRLGGGRVGLDGLVREGWPFMKGPRNIGDTEGIRMGATNKSRWGPLGATEVIRGLDGSRSCVCGRGRGTGRAVAGSRCQTQFALLNFNKFV